MRVAARADGVSVHAISGTRAVMLAMDANEAARRDLLGFAIHAHNRTNGRKGWLRGFKFFKAVVPDPEPGERRSTLEHPIQSFLWGHYAAEPGEEYEYTIRPMRRPASGDLSALDQGSDVAVSIRTEPEWQDGHSVFFNRGAIVSQKYAEQFGNQPPEKMDDPDDAAVKWLSRGLLEAALAFIGEAKDATFELRAAVYEFTYKPILEAFAAAAGRGAHVRIVYEAGHRGTDDVLMPSSQGDKNKDEIAKLPPHPRLEFIGRTRHISIPHNKFIVLLENGHPVALWTGSTNFTPSGFIGQTNVGHAVSDDAVAAAYNGYWEQLRQDPHRAALKAWCMANSPRPGATLPAQATVALFSPRGSTGMLGWYGARMDEAAQTVMLTSAFGVTRKLAEHFDVDRDYLRFIFMERKNRSAETQAMLERDRDTVISLGRALGTKGMSTKIEGWKLDKWFRREEHFRKRGHIFYVHTKIMMLDVLSADPLVFTGSANFSPNSLSSNDENMLLIRGDTRVADIYLTEFQRLFNHFYFRTVANERAETGDSDIAKAVYLDPTDRWTKRYFTPGRFHSRRRELFRAP